MLFDSSIKGKAQRYMAKIAVMAVMIATPVLYFAGGFMQQWRYKNSDEEVVRAKVTEINRIGTYGGRPANYIETDKGTFLNVDDRLSGKFNRAADLQFMIYKDSTYDFTLKGVDSRLYGLKRNVMDIKSVPKSK